MVRADCELVLAGVVAFFMVNLCFSVSKVDELDMDEQNEELGEDRREEGDEEDEQVEDVDEDEEEDEEDDGEDEAHGVITILVLLLAEPPCCCGCTVLFELVDVE